MSSNFTDQNIRLILLPGFDGTGLLFEPLLRIVGAPFVPVVVSYPTDRICSANELLEIVLSHLPTNEPFVIISESFSGPFALKASRVHSNPPLAVVLSASFAKCPVSPLLIKTLKVGSDAMKGGIPPHWLVKRYLLGDATSDVFDLFYKAAASVVPEVLTHRFDVLSEFDEKFIPSALVCPLLYLQAKRDKLISLRNVSFLEGRYPSVTIERVDSPHLLLQTQAMAAFEIITKFLTSLTHGN